MTNEPKEQGEENVWSFLICYHFGLNWRSSNVLSYVYWTNFCYTLIDLLACVPYYSMHVLNKHEGLSKKKKYPEVTLDNFGFPVGGRLAARRAVFQPPGRNLAILSNSHFPREVPLILDRGQRNLVGPSGPPII